MTASPVRAPAVVARGSSPAWPRPAADWRLRRTSVRDAVTSVGGVLGTAFLLPLAAGGARTLGFRMWTPTVLGVGALVLALAHVLLRVTRPRDTERCVEVLRTPLVPGVEGAPMDGERRGPLDRTWTLLHSVAVVAAVTGALVLSATAGTRGPAFAVGGAMIVAAACVAVRHLWQGGVELRWAPETLATGRRATLYVATPAWGARLLEARYLLRCVEPVPGRARAEVWSAERSSCDLGPPGPDEFVHVTFDVPGGAPASLLGTTPPVFWELVVQGRSLWGTVTESFLLPVRRGPESAAP